MKYSRKKTGMVDSMGNRGLAGHLAALCGICLYYLLENIALTYTMASNVGVIISVAPFFTAILSHLFMKSEGKLRINFFIGFVVEMAGVMLISFNGSKLELNPMGDILAVAGLFLSEYNGKGSGKDE